MPAELSPPELARLVDVADASRRGDWSMRSALTRYAQPEPHRSQVLLALVRRFEATVHGHERLLRSDGPNLLAESASASVAQPDAPDRARVVGLLGVARKLDELADTLVDWALDITRPRPSDAVDEAVVEVARVLDELGVPEEELRGRPPRTRG